MELARNYESQTGGCPREDITSDAADESIVIERLKNDQPGVPATQVCIGVRILPQIH